MIHFGPQPQYARFMPMVAHGLDRIVDQIEHNLVQLDWIAQHQSARVIGQIQLHCDIFRTDCLLRRDKTCSMSWFTSSTT